MESVRRFYAEKAGRVPRIGEAADYLVEEWREFKDSEDGSEHQAKELADLVFTLAGYALAVGIDLDVAFRLVAESNMTKEPTPTGKVRKGAAYVEPDLSAALLRKEVMPNA